VRYDGETYEVVGLDGRIARLRARGGRLGVVLVQELAGAEDFEVLDGVQRGPALRSDELDDLPDGVLEQALDRLGHVREVETGYRSGNPEAPAPGEPRHEYHPRFTSVTQRVGAKASELGVSRATINRWRRGLEERGLIALADGRAGRRRSIAGRLDPRAREVFLEVMDGLTRKSNASVKRVIEESEARLEEKYGEGVVPLPSRATLYRAVEDMDRGKHTFGSAKRRREAAARPRTPYESFDATRPGEVVFIDATALDVFALDVSSSPPKWTSLELVVCLDAFTRSILAWRFVPRGAKAVDAALLLRDMIVPKTLRFGWPDSARWPYHGVPERIVIGAFEGLRAVAGVPVVRPETVVIDRALAFDSTVFRAACNLLGVSVQPSRPYRPTDKAHIERMFRTIRGSLLERMPGYKGPDLWSRGERVEDTAYYFAHEVEEIFAAWVVEHWQNEPHEGLRLFGASRETMSPNEAYELGLQTAGFVYVPPDPDLYFELLPIHWRKTATMASTSAGSSTTATSSTRTAASVPRTPASTLGSGRCVAIRATCPEPTSRTPKTEPGTSLGWSTRRRPTGRSTTGCSSTPKPFSSPAAGWAAGATATWRGCFRRSSRAWSRGASWTRRSGRLSPGRRATPSRRPRTAMDRRRCGSSMRRRTSASRNRSDDQKPRPKIPILHWPRSWR
jgi:DNA-binding MarR family transcriptional regulator